MEEAHALRTFPFENERGRTPQRATSYPGETPAEKLDKDSSQNRDSDQLVTSHGMGRALFIDACGWNRAFAAGRVDCACRCSVGGTGGCGK